jgi:putative FmdB family regulatory protein
MMPTYDYKCDNGHVTEAFEPMSAPTEHPCPECPQPPFESHENEDDPYCMCEPSLARRQIGAGSGFSFKGGAPTKKFHRRG